MFRNKGCFPDMRGSRTVVRFLFLILLTMLQIQETGARQATPDISQNAGTKKRGLQRIETPKVNKRRVNAPQAAHGGRSNSSYLKRAKRPRRHAVRKSGQAANLSKGIGHFASSTPAKPPGGLAGQHNFRSTEIIRSNAVFVLDEESSEVLLDKNADSAMPIASLTKLMTAIVVIEAGQSMKEVLEITHEDVDRIKYSASRLPVGTKLSRADLMHIALMSSENRAASALGRHFPGGLPAFVDAMNAKAKALNMNSTRFVEPTGLSSDNVASARDMAKLAAAAYAYPLIAEYSTSDMHTVRAGKRTLQYVNSNRLIGKPDWNIHLQKTGYITEAGRCLVMKVDIGQRPVIMVFLDSEGHLTRFADARRLRDWIIRAGRRTDTVLTTLGHDRS